MEERYNITDKEQTTAYRMIESTNISFFLAGRAGTGKTTFLRNVQSGIDKNFVVLAPTGQAAINAGGQTIHSFFGFNFGVLGPGEIGTMNREKIGLVRHLDTIIIDEVSMVRCDIIDAIDRTLRHYVGNSAPFGGIQMVFIGDMFQLEPIATARDREMLKEIYHRDSFFFYDAAAIRSIRLPKIEFLHIYRQNDPEFIELLEHVRLGRMTDDDLAKINSRVSSCGDDEMRITLTSTNADARRINDERLAGISSDAVTYDAVFSGKTNATSDVAEAKLVLKVGAQVMFTKNDRSHRWVNGTIGEVTELREGAVKVRIGNGEEYLVQKEVWESLEYEYDHRKKCCTKTVTGKVEQFPLKLAWAITIHKSQSLTFEKVAVDFGRGAFSNGQAYVALSRARTFDGLALLRPMNHSSVRVSRAVLDFASDFNDGSVIERVMSVGEAIVDLERNMDFDGTASQLYDMAVEASLSGCRDMACDCLSRAMEHVVDDGCLMGRKWTVLGNGDNECRIADACGLYYSGEKDAAEDILHGLGDAWLENNLLGLYILGRCLEDKARWDELEQVYLKMFDIYDSVREMGMDSIAFRKLKYRLAILNERQYGDPGLAVIRDLISEAPSYDKYHQAFRWMLLKHPELVEEWNSEIAEGAGSERLVSVLLDRTKSEEEFLDRLRMERAEMSEDWKEYRHLINSLKLQSPI